VSLGYTVILEPEEDGGYHVYAPALKGCHSYGDTIEEALANTRETIAVYLEDVRAAGEPVPTEDLTIQPVEVAARAPGCRPRPHIGAPGGDGIPWVGQASTLVVN
jgi:predicted RNase H-like HicB family nuclease